MKRPPYGKKIMRGITLWLEVLRQWWQAGFVPQGWTKSDERDADAAVKWLIKMVAWYEQDK